MRDGFADHGENSPRVRNAMPLLGDDQWTEWRLGGPKSYIHSVVVAVSRGLSRSSDASVPHQPKLESPPAIIAVGDFVGTLHRQW